MPLNNLGTATGTIKINTSDLKNADIALRSAGRGMIGVGIAAVGAFGAIVAEAAKFEKEMDFVQAVTDATEGQMKELQDAAIELGKSSIYGPNQLAQAFVELAKAGASVEDITGGVGEAAVMLATAADVEIPFAGENLINILNTFKLGAEDAVHVSDQLAGAANASSVELADIVTTMRYAGPVAQALSIPLEEVNEAITVLGRVGIKGSVAGTSLRFAMSHLIPDTKKATEAIEGLGLHIDESTGAVIEFTEQDGSLKSLSDIFQVLQDQTKDLTEQQRIAVVNDIFGVRAMPSVIELMNAGKNGFMEMSAESERTTAADVAAKRMDNLDGSIKRLKATLSAIMIDAGGPFQQTVKGWVDGLRDLLIAFDNLPDPMKNFLVSGLLVFGVTSLLAGGFLLTIGNMVRAVRVIGELANAFALLGTGIGKTVVAVGRLTLVLLASPWFWLAVAIVAVIVAIYLLWTRCEGFREFIKDFWEDLKRWGKAIGDFFVDAWNAVKDFFANWDQWWGKIKEGASAAWDAVKGFFGDIGGAIAEFVSGIWEDIANGVGEAWDAVSGFFEDIGGWFADLPGLIGGYAEEAVDFVIDQFRRLSWKNVGYAIGRAIGTTLRYIFYEIPHFVAEALADALRTMWDWYNDILTVLHDVEWGIIHWAEDTFMMFLNTIWGWISQIPGLFLQFLTDATAWLLSFIPQFASAAWNIGWNVFHGIIDFIQQIPGAVGGFLWDTLNWLIDHVDDFFGAAWDIGTAVWDGIIGFVSDIPGAVLGFLDDAIGWIRDRVGDVWDAAWDFGNGLWEGFWDGISGSPKSKIEYALMDIVAQAETTDAALARSMRSMNRTAYSMPISSPAVGLPSPQAASGSAAWNQNGPLVGTAVIRKDSDITELARQLEERRQQEARARGIRLQPSYEGIGA